MLNSVNIMGRLTKAPELKYTSEGLAVLNFDIANSVKYKDKEVTTFLRCVSYGRGAEVINQFVKKGDRVLLSGNLRQNSYTDAKGENKSFIYLQVENFDFIESKQTKEQTLAQNIKEVVKKNNVQDVKGVSIKEIMNKEFNEIPF